MAVTATHIGVFGTGAPGLTASLPTVADIPAGQLAIIACYVGSTGIISASDTAGNTWTAHTALSDTETTNRIVLLRAENTQFLASGSTISLSSTVSTRWAVSAAVFDGMATSSAFDIQTVGNGFTTSTTPSALATGTPNQAASLALGVMGLNSGYADTFTQPTGYTALTKGGTTGENGVFWGWKELASATAETYGPATISTARTGLAGAYVFKVAAVAPPAAAGGLMLLGVG